MVRSHPEHPDLCYHSCPACQGRIQEPFLRHSGIFAYLHRRRGQAPCKVILIAGVGGFELGPDQSLEDALVRQVRGVA